MRNQSLFSLPKLAFALGLIGAALLGCGGDETKTGDTSPGSGGSGGGSSSTTSAGGAGGEGQGGGGDVGGGGVGGGGGEGGSAPQALIRYVGRFDTKDPAGPRFGWPGSAIITRFSGTSLGVKFKDSSSPGASNFFQVVIDGNASKAIEVNNQTELYQVAQGLPDGEHDLVLHRRTEGHVQPTQLLEFVPEAGKTLLPVKTAPNRRIEIIGDSISAGYGVDGPNESCTFSTPTENNYLAYGPVTARMLNADATIIAWSGIGVYRNYGGSMDNTMPQVYERTIPTEGGSMWDFSAWAPHAVVINLGTNDFSIGDPGEQPFTDAYKGLVSKVRSHYPDAYIFCAVGPMLTDSYPAGEQRLTKARAYVNKVVNDRTAQGDTKMRFVEFPTQQVSDGLGCDYHPGVKTNQIMAQTLASALQKELGW